METRLKTNIYLLGSCESEILGVKLPSYRQAFGFFLHLHQVKKKTIRDASREAIKVVTTFWDKAGIPVRPEQHLIVKLEKVFDEWRGLQKHSTRLTPAHKSKEDQFLIRLDDLFDIAHADALTLITIQEDRAFLLSQREKGRAGSIGAIDMVRMRCSQRTQERVNAEELRQKRSQRDMKASTSQAILISDSSSSTIVANETDKKERDVGPSVTKRGRINIMSPGLASALDRTKISSRNATFVLGEVTVNLGHDVHSLNINRSSIHRARALHRATISNKLKTEFTTTVPLTVHWDGKLMEDLTSKEHVDRLPVLISGANVEQLLGVPKLLSGTGAAQSAAVIDCLEKWGVSNRVIALCFDTTASNTGHRSGACSLIEQKLGKDLLYLACRHHILELVVAAAFEKTTLGVSTGPEILLFKRFRDKWRLININIFEPASTDPSVELLVSPTRASILDFAQTQLEIHQPRDDYREFLELSVIYLGGTPARGVRFQIPGAMHRARWMAKVIYTIKIWLFRSQFRMTAREKNGIRDMAIFSVLVHLRAWMTAPIAAETPLNDFRLMGELLRYPDKAISESTAKKLGLNLWYLSEELVGLSLFDSRISLKSKRLMLAAMNEEAPDHPPKRPRIESSVFLESRGLEQFFTINSKKLFTSFGFSNEFLSKDPTEWEDDISYQAARHTVSYLAVVNDRAERGVALIQDFNKRLTKGEEQLQFLLQIVRDHRRNFPNSLKSTIFGKPNHQ